MQSGSCTCKVCMGICRLECTVRMTLCCTFTLTERSDSTSALPRSAPPCPALPYFSLCITYQGQWRSAAIHRGERISMAVEEMQRCVFLTSTASAETFLQVTQCCQTFTQRCWSEAKHAKLMAQAAGLAMIADTP